MSQKEAVRLRIIVGKNLIFKDTAKSGKLLRTCSPLKKSHLLLLLLLLLWVSSTTQSLFSSSLLSPTTRRVLIPSFQSSVSEGLNVPSWLGDAFDSHRGYGISSHPSFVCWTMWALSDCCLAWWLCPPNYGLKHLGQWYNQVFLALTIHSVQEGLRYEDALFKNKFLRAFDSHKN